MAQQGTPEGDLTLQYEKFLNGEVELESFPEDIQEQILQGQFNPSAEEPSAPTEPVVEDNQPSPEPTPSPEPSEQKTKDVNLRYKEKSDELNTLVQREKSHIKRMQTDPEYARQWLADNGVQLTTDTPEAPTDVYSEEFQVSQKERLDRIENQLKTSAREEQERAERSAQRKEIDQLGETFPSLKLEGDFDTINSQYASAYNACGGDLSKFQDEAFAKEQSAKGVELPSGPDFEKYLTIAEVVSKRKQVGYPTLRSAYMDSDKFDPRTAYGSVEQPTETPNQTVILDSASSPSPGFHENTGGKTPEGFEAFMKANPDETVIASNPELKKEWESWMEWAGM